MQDIGWKRGRGPAVPDTAFLDIQLMEFATRHIRRKFVPGLSQCMEKDLIMTIAERQIWQAASKEG
jgi:hypothetical protein